MFCVCATVLLSNRPLSSNTKCRRNLLAIIPRPQTLVNALRPRSATTGSARYVSRPGVRCALTTFDEYDRSSNFVAEIILIVMFSQAQQLEDEKWKEDDKHVLKKFDRKEERERKSNEKSERKQELK